jgi:hypothetical protein
MPTPRPTEAPHVFKTERLVKIDTTQMDRNDHLKRINKLLKIYNSSDPAVVDALQDMRDAFPDLPVWITSKHWWSTERAFIHCGPHVKYENGVKSVVQEFTVMDEDVLPSVLRQWSRWSVNHVSLAGERLKEAVYSKCL